jgi:hypothetical protein
MTALQSLYQNNGVTSLLMQSSTQSTIDRVDMSLMAKLMNTVSGASAEGKTAMEQFRTQMMNDVKNGTFDAAQAAEDAPQMLKDFAEENGIDLEEMLQKMADGMEARQAMMPPPPMQLSNAISGLSEDEEDAIDQFQQQILDAIKNGTFDAAQAAEEAPEALQAYAAENRIDLEAMLQDMADHAPTGQGTMPPPPTVSYNSSGNGITGISQNPIELLLQAFAASQDQGTSSWTVQS